MILRSYESGFAISNSIVLDSFVGSTAPALFYNTQSEQRYSYRDSYFINNTGSRLFFLEGMTRDITLSYTEPDPYNLGWFVNFGDVMFRINSVATLLEAQAAS